VCGREREKERKTQTKRVTTYTYVYIIKKIVSGESEIHISAA
jgi:hypothetical protein